MMRVCVSLILALSLTSNTPVPGMSPIGVVLHANNAYVGETEASVGTTLFEGDRLTTDADGELGIRSGAMLLQVDAQTNVTLTALGTDHTGTGVELASGTLVFSAARGAAVEIRANGTITRPTAGGPTIAHVRVVGPKELRIFARRGAVEFSYGDEREVIAEGSCYRVILDPDDGRTPGAAKTPAAQAHRAFLLIAIGVGAAAAGLAGWHIFSMDESPHRP